MEADLHGRICVVFGGGNGGIGFAFAKQALERFNMCAILCDIDGKRCMEAAASLKSPEKVIGIEIDISNELQMQGLKEQIQQHFGSSTSVAIVLNAAAVFADSVEHDSLAASQADWELAYRVNVFGAVNVQRFALEVLSRKEPSFLIQVSSLSAFTGGSGEPYVSSKTALVSLTESLHRTLKIRNTEFKYLSVHVVLPGVVTTNFAASSYRAKQAITKRYVAKPRTTMSAIPKESLQALELREMMKMGLSPSSVAARIFEGIRMRQFYIVVDNEPPIDLKQALTGRMQAILSGGDNGPCELEVPPIVHEARRRVQLKSPKL